MTMARSLNWKNIRQLLTGGKGTKQRMRMLKSRYAQLEQLESRQLMAVLDTITGRLTVDGTPSSDNIRLTNTGGMVSVVLNGASDPIAVSGVGTRTSVPTTWVRAITVNGGWGNDRLDTSAVPVSALLNGNGQSDTLIGGSAQDFLNGDEGDDWLYGRGGIDYMFGGPGRDNLIGGEGGDYLYGGTENDILYGEAGTDFLRGERGDDTLVGGSEIDNFDGGIGDADRTDAVYGESASNLENAMTGPSLIVNGARGTDIRQYSNPYGVFYSHLSGMASILTARGRNLANERIEFKGRDSVGNAYYTVNLFTSSGAPVTRTVVYNGSTAGEPERVDGEVWVSIFERAFMDQVRAEDPTASLWTRYWDHRTVMMIVNGSSEAVHMLDHLSVTFGAKLGDEHFENIASAVEASKLVTAATWTTPGRGRSTTAVLNSHNYTVVGVNRVSKTITLRNPWGYDIDSSGTPSGDPWDGLVTISWDNFRGSFQGYNVGVVA